MANGDGAGGASGSDGDRGPKGSRGANGIHAGEVNGHAPAPFQLPPSEEEWRSRRNIGCALAATAAALSIAAGAPKGQRFDPFSCIAGGYTVFLFCFQNSFAEWPELSRQLMLVMSGAMGAFVAPAGLQSIGLWRSVFCRAATWTLDAALMASAYITMIRGPRFDLPKGSLRGRNVVITGCNTGIGYEAAVELAIAGAKVIFACRSEERARAAMDRLVKESRGAVAEDQLEFMPVDVASLASVRSFCEQLQASKLTIHTLVLNAGVMMRNRVLSEDGFELTYASNHFGHFLMVLLLLPHLLSVEARGEKPRIVFVGSNICYKHGRFDWGEVVQVKDEKEKQQFLAKPYEMFRSYGQSKQATLFFVSELAQRLRNRGSKIPVNAIHPGEVLTEVMRDMHPFILWIYKVFKPVAKLLIKTPRQGASCTIHVASSPALATSDVVSGAYFLRLRPGPLPKVVQNPTHRSQLWALCERLTGVTSPV